MSKITIKDVAKYAGVSVSSVSNVINGMNKCSEETKIRILEAMNELEYKPNLTAKALVQKKSNLIGVLYDNNNDSHEKILKGVESFLRINGEFDFLSMPYVDSNLVQEWILRRSLDGVILVGDFQKNVITYLKELKVPIVCVDNYREIVENVGYINSEDTLGAYLATEQLIKSGVLEPCILTVKENEISNRRYLGYLTCLEDYGIEFKEEMLIEIQKEDFLEGKLVGATLGYKGIKGILCTSDILALGILKSLYNFKIPVPQEIKVIGFDNLTGSEYTNPSLTTVDTGSFKKGEKACELLIKLIDGVEIKKYEISIEIKIIKRETL